MVLTDLKITMLAYFVHIGEQLTRHMVSKLFPKECSMQSTVSRVQPCQLQSEALGRSSTSKEASAMAHTSLFRRC